MVDLGNADGHKSAECMARPAGTALLHKAYHVCAGELPYSVAHHVCADGHGTDLWADDNGGGSVADIFPPKGSDILMVFGVLHSGRGLLAADNGKRSVAKVSR